MSQINEWDGLFFIYCKYLNLIFDLNYILFIVSLFLLIYITNFTKYNLIEPTTQLIPIYSIQLDLFK